MSNKLRVEMQPGITPGWGQSPKFYLNGVLIEDVREVAYERVEGHTMLYTMVFSVGQIEKVILPDRRAKKAPPKFADLFNRRSRD